MSLAGWGVDAVEDAAAAAVNVAAQTLGWGLQQTLPEPVLGNMAHLLPFDWSDRLGLREYAVQSAVTQQQTGYSAAQIMEQRPVGAAAVQSVALGQQ
jgi:hypothetical protein